jgi:SOS-response transcriptional repressor LexA
MRCPNCRHDFVPRLQPLTPKQHALYSFIVRTVAEKGYSPSFNDIADAFGYHSLSTVFEHLTGLERKGYIERSPGESRAIRCMVSLEDAKALAHPALMTAAAERVDDHARRAESIDVQREVLAQLRDHPEGLHENVIRQMVSAATARTFALLRNQHFAMPNDRHRWFILDKGRCQLLDRPQAVGA